MRSFMLWLACSLCVSRCAIAQADEPGSNPPLVEAENTDAQPERANEADAESSLELRLDAPASTQAQAPAEGRAGTLALEQPSAPRYRIVEERQWYGGRTLLLDTAMVLLMVLGLGAESDWLPVIGLVGYFAGAPIVHLASGEAPASLGRATISLLLRAGLPLAFGTIAVVSTSCDSEDGDGLCDLAAAVVGGLLGGLTAIVVDAALVSYRTVKKSVAIEPVALVREDGLYLGARGSF